VGKDGREIAFNFDGTWWRVGLRLPRKKGRKRPADPYVMATLKRIVAAEDARGVPHEQALATADRWIPSTLGLQKKAGKWFALISYRQPMRPQIQVQNVMVIHCGLRVFAVANDLQGMLTRRRAEWIHGSPLLARKFRFRKQRQKIQRETRKYAVHGRGHAYQARNQIDDKERAFVDDWLRRRALRIVNLAKERNAKIFVMSMDNIRKRVERSDLPDGIRVAVHQAPWFKFRTFIEQDAKKLGVPVETYTPWWHTQRCPNPACATRSAAFPHYDRTWRFHCTACGYEQNIEVVALQNALWDLANEKRIELPAGVDTTVIFRAIKEEAQEAAETRRKNREKAHFTPLGAERFGGETFRSKEKRGVAGESDRQNGSRSRKGGKEPRNTRLSEHAVATDAETRKR
jgi:IS605 OrfB family transposase